MLEYEAEDLDDVMLSSKFAYELAAIAAQAESTKQAMRLLALEFLNSERVLVEPHESPLAIFDGPEVSLWLLPDCYVTINNKVCIQLNAI